MHCSSRQEAAHSRTANGTTNLVLQLLLSLLQLAVQVPGLLLKPRHRLLQVCDLWTQQPQVAPPVVSGKAVAWASKSPDLPSICTGHHHIPLLCCCAAVPIQAGMQQASMPLQGTSTWARALRSSCWLLAACAWAPCS